MPGPPPSESGATQSPSDQGRARAHIKMRRAVAAAPFHSEDSDRRFNVQEHEGPPHTRLS